MDLTQKDFCQIQKWMYRNARPLDLARWRYHFEGGPQEAVLKALSAYQNEDGGFGHALEADAWNPNSVPLQTSTAIERLGELGIVDNAHPVITGILKYLDSGADMEGNTWHNVIPSNNDYPHAPWWHTDSHSTSHSMYNPTAILAGFILRFAAQDSALYERGVNIATELCDQFLLDPAIEMHPLMCVLFLLECIKEHGGIAGLPYDQLLQAAEAQLNFLLERGAGDWNGYSCRPSAFIHSPESLGYTRNAALMEQELDYLLDIRNSEGIWELTWTWAGYDKEFAISENWWKADIAIKNLLLLRAFGRLETE